jgi:hypothetical protein
MRFVKTQGFLVIESTYMLIEKYSDRAIDGGDIL